MTPALQAVYDAVLQRAAQAPFAESARTLREGFAERCGRYDPDHPAAERRQAAAWEDALVRGKLAAAVAPELPQPERRLARALCRAQRGIFVFRLTGEQLVAVDLWSGAELLMLERDDVAKELVAAGLSEGSPLCQARLLASPDGCAVLPGALFHPADARPCLERTLQQAHHRGLGTDDVLDALLRMEHTWQTLSRVKVGYAYRPEALPAARTAQ